MPRPALWCLVVLSCTANVGFGPAPAVEPTAPLPEPARRMPAEFEDQQSVFLCWNAHSHALQATYINIIRELSPRLDVVVLVPDAVELRSATHALASARLPADAVQFLLVRFNTIWTRDYGPVALIDEQGNSRLVDADYKHADRGDDDRVPRALGALFRTETAQAPVTIDGGNLLTNGEGLCLSTTYVIDENRRRGYDESTAARVLGDTYGFDQVLFLEPLSGEPTGHVDMFATFTAPRTVVVGAYDPQVDPVNAAILDRNAQRLVELETEEGPLEVIRMPMPTNSDGIWRTFTNVVYANGTVLVPVYPGIDHRKQAMALALYRELLPDWKVAPVDCNELVAWGGALRCITRNVTRLTDSPADTHHVARRYDGQRSRGPVIARLRHRPHPLDPNGWSENEPPQSFLRDRPDLLLQFQRARTGR